MQKFHLDQTLQKLAGPPQEQIRVQNYWAATGFDKYHQNSSANFEIEIEGIVQRAILSWNSSFSKVAMKEKKDIANQGGVALAWFVMSVILEFSYVEQTEIGDGVDYRFRKDEPADDDLNFMDDFHYVEISGILEESKTNTLKGRIKEKHTQINRGGKRNKSSSVIVTLFSQPKTIKENYK